MACSSYSSERAADRFWRSAVSKLPCPMAAISSICKVSRALMRRGFAVTAVNAAAVDSCAPPLAFAAAVSAVVVVASL